MQKVENNHNYCPVKPKQKIISGYPIHTLNSSMTSGCFYFSFIRSALIVAAVLVAVTLHVVVTVPYLHYLQYVSALAPVQVLTQKVCIEFE